jgi:hypothetical protein
VGQQQLLLIVLGVLVIGIAIVVAISVFNASAMETNREAVIIDLTNIALMAQQYYRKPAILNGGSYTFNNWAIPPPLVQTSNMSVAVTATVAAQSVILVGLGTEIGKDGSTVVGVTMVVGPNSIISTTINN